MTTVNLRLKTALEAGLTPICCVGDVFVKERELDSRTTCCGASASAPSTPSLPRSAAKLVVRLRTGVGDWHRQNRPLPNSGKAHAVIRREAAEVFGEEFAAKLRILYGGSGEAG